MIARTAILECRKLATVKQALVFAKMMPMFHEKVVSGHA